MTVKKFILSGLALGAMLMGSNPAHATTQFDLGTLPSVGFAGKQVNNSVGELNIFKFFHAGAGGELNLATVNVTAGKNLELDLYEDTDKDGVFNSGKDALVKRTSIGGENGDRAIFTIQNAGTYFALVIPSAPSTSYAFIASTTGSKESNLIAASKVLSSLNAQFQLPPLNDKHTSDFYKFDLSSGQQVKITMTPTGGKAQMRVVQDAGFDHNISLGTEIVKSTPASSSQQILTVSGPGKYYLQVSQSVAGQTVATDVKFQP